MTEEIQSAITSDKVETDNTNFATVRADQRCETALVPRENPFRQLSWQVTVEKGAVYSPQEDVGIYAQEVECKYGAQIDGDIFGRESVTVEYGGAVHGGTDGKTIGARVLGSLFSEGEVDVTAAGAQLEDWEEAPVTVYGDIVGEFVTVDRPTIVYGSVHAEQAFRTNALTVVLGDVRSEGVVEASDLFVFSLSAQEDIVLGDNVIVVNPVIRSEWGSIRFPSQIGLFHPELYTILREHHGIDTVGFWVFDQEEVWQTTLSTEDVRAHGDGQVVDRSWRTINEPGDDYYERLREVLEEVTRATRKDPPDVEEFRYAGITTLDSGSGETTIEGDVVVGSQEKTVEDTDMTKIDQSTTEIDQSTEVHDESTTVEDSVVNRSDIGNETEDTE